MKYLVAAAAALSVLGGSAALAQPYAYGGVNAYYGQQPYGGYYGTYAGVTPFGYAQPAYPRGYVYNPPVYRSDRYRPLAYGYGMRADRHFRPAYRNDRHAYAARGGYRRGH